MAQTKYATVANLKIKLKDYTNNEYDQNMLDRSLLDASALIDGYLAAFYDLTDALYIASPLIEALCLSLAAALTQGTQFQDWDQSASTWESKLYRWVIDTLRGLQDGTITLPNVGRKGI